MIINGKEIKILDEVDYGQIRNILEKRMKESKMGCVKPYKQAQVITAEVEEML